MRSIRSTAAVLTALALVAAGCGGGGSTQSGPTQTSDDLGQTYDFNEQPRDAVADGGSLTTALPEITAQFNTFHADGSGYTLDLWRWYNPTLMLFAPDGTASPDPDYLVGYDKAEVDGTTVVTYTINPAAVYNDGSPIDWRSFENTWKASNGSNEAFQTASTDGYDQIASVTRGVDDRQAVVTFTGLYAWVDGLFNVLLNPEVSTPQQFNKAYVDDPHPEWGAGPFTLQSYDKANGSISFTRNPTWWGDPGKLETRTFRALESVASINAFKAGEIDALDVASRDRLAQVQGMDDVIVRRSVSAANRLLTLNADRPHLADLDVRKAVFGAIDRETLQKIEFNGLDYTEDLPGSLSLFGFQPGYEDNLTAAGYTYDPGAAGELLDQAGWAMGDGDYREKDGQTLTLVFATIGDDPTSTAEANAVTSMLKAIGVEVTIDNHPSSEFSDVFLGGQFDLFTLSFSSSDPFGFAYFCQYWCSDSELNGSGTGTPEIDTEVQALARTGDPDAQIAAGNKLEQKIMAETYGLMPWFNGPTVYAVRDTLANDGTGQGFWVGRIQDIGYVE